MSGNVAFVSADESFPPEASAELKTYVYRLIDPRNGETFYVGKGRANRVFAHIHAEEGIDGDEVDNKLRRIRQIRLAGFEVAHVIHRHGMDDATAFQVEAALMDAYPGLTNIAGGYGTGDYGAMHAKEIIRRYTAEPAVFEHRALLIGVNRTAAEMSLYEVPGARRCPRQVGVHRRGGTRTVPDAVCRQARARRVPEARRGEPDQVHVSLITPAAP
jgi:hypothetical protein